MEIGRQETLRKKKARTLSPRRSMMALWVSRVGRWFVKSLVTGKHVTEMAFRNAGDPEQETREAFWHWAEGQIFLMCLCRCCKPPLHCFCLAPFCCPALWLEERGPHSRQVLQEFWRSFSGLTSPAGRSHAQRLSSLQSFEKAFPLRMVTQSLLLKLVTSIATSNLRQKRKCLGTAYF